MQEGFGIFNTNSTPALGIILAVLSALPVILTYTIIRPKFVKRDIKDKKMNILSLVNFILFVLNIILLIIYTKSFDIKSANLAFGIMVFFYIIYYELYFRYIYRGKAQKELFSRLLYIRVPWYISMSLSFVFAGIWSKCIPLIITSLIFSVTNIYNANYKYLKFFTEYRDLYDEKRRKTGKKMLKDGIHPKGLKHITVAVFIYNPKNKMWLIQKRSKDKGSKWGTTSGHPVSGQSSIEGMITEIKEEIGLDVKKEELELITTIEGSKKFIDVYYLEKDIDIEKLKLQEEEVQDIKWMTRREIDALYKSNKFKKSHYKYFEKKLDVTKMK